MTEPIDQPGPTASSGATEEPVIDAAPVIYEEPDIAPPEDQVRASSGLRTATVVSARVVVGILAVAVAGATVAAAALVPLASFRVAVPQSIVTPVPTAEQLVCPGGALQLSDASGADASRSSALGRAAVTATATGSGFDRKALAASDAGTGGTASAPQLLSMPPATGSSKAGLLSGAQSESVETPDVVGVSSAACTAAVGDTWLVGGSTTVGRTTLITLADPSAVSATVSLEIFGENGAVTSPGMDGIVVPAGGQRVLSLAGFAPNLASPVVHVQSKGGQIVANLQQTTVRGIEPGGIDFVGSQNSPTRTTVIPGVVLAATGAAQARLGESGFSDLETVLRVFLPGTKSTSASVSVIPESGSVKPTSAPSTPAASSGSDAGTPTGTAIKVSLDPNKVTDLPLDDLADGSYTIVITTALPVLAGVRVSTAGTAAVAARTDFAWLGAAANLSSDVLVPVSSVSSKGRSSLLHLDNPTKTAAKVTLRAVRTTDGSGSRSSGRNLSVTVPAGAAVTVPVVAGASYRISGFTSLYVAVTTVTNGGVTGYAVQPAEESSSPLRIYR
jgi:hypothetical protein